MKTEKPEIIIISSGTRKAEVIQKSPGKSKTIHLKKKGNWWTDKDKNRYTI
jgi:hypothetical protein